MADPGPPDPLPKLPVVVAVTGASGSAYARRLVQELVAQHVETHLIFSRASIGVVQEELGISLGALRTHGERFLGKASDLLTVHAVDRFDSPLARGGVRTLGMVVIPCSMGRLGSFAAGTCRDLIDRAVEVTLKEGRKLVLVPRETPLSRIALRNMLTLAEAGACVLPAMPAFYTHPRNLEDVVGFIAGKAMDQLGISHTLYPRYGAAPS